MFFVPSEKNSRLGRQQLIFTLPSPHATARSRSQVSSNHKGARSAPELCSNHRIAPQAKILGILFLEIQIVLRKCVCLTSKSTKKPAALYSWKIWFCMQEAFGTPSAPRGRMDGYFYNRVPLVCFWGVAKQGILSKMHRISDRMLRGILSNGGGFRV